jgi:hypothetical protein
MFAGDPCPVCRSQETVIRMQQDVKFVPDLSVSGEKRYVVLGRLEELKCEKCGHKQVQQWGSV